MTGQDRLRRPVDLDWTLGDLVEHRAAEHGDRVALRSADGAVVSYSSLASRVAGVRALLTDRVGIGARVGLVMANTLAYPIVWLGVVSAGMTAVPVNKRSGPVDARYLLDHSGAHLVLADASTRDLAVEATDGIDRPLAIEEVGGGAAGGRRARRPRRVPSVHVHARRRPLRRDGLLLPGDDAGPAAAPAADGGRPHARLRRVWCSAIPPDLHAALERRWGVPWNEVFGMTETG